MHTHPCVYFYCLSFQGKFVSCQYLNLFSWLRSEILNAKQVWVYYILGHDIVWENNKQKSKPSISLMWPLMVYDTKHAWCGSQFDLATCVSCRISFLEQVVIESQDKRSVQTENCFSHGQYLRRISQKLCSVLKWRLWGNKQCDSFNN